MSADPVQLLDRLSPPDGWSEPTDLEVDPVAAAILDRVLADDGSNVVSLDAARRRRRRGLGGAIVVAALVAGGAVAAIWNRSPEETQRVGCWSEAVFPPSELLSIAWDGQADPVQLCAGAWSDGPFTEADAPPPDLEACVTGDDGAAVIPGDGGVCDRLGFATFSGSPDQSTVAVNEAQERFDQEFNVRTCVPPDLAEQETARLLDEYGLSGWTIKFVGTFSDDEPSATVSLSGGAVANIAPLPADR